MTDWRPSASLRNLKRRGQLLAQIRAFFADRQVLEADVPLLGETGVTDLHIDCVTAQVQGRRHYLQSSPEYYLKRLLAAGCDSVYYLGKAFRDEVAGRRHRPEFTLLEWYRPGWNEQQLMAELEELLASVAPGVAGNCSRLSYREAFQASLGLDPHSAALDQLRGLAAEVAGAHASDWSGESRSHCLDLLFSLVVEPSLLPGLVLIGEFPACQAALARLGTDAAGALVARRFEAFVNGMELANGYFELTDPLEQRARFERDLQLRSRLGKAPMTIDERLLAALHQGLPPCAGVALGVDRLLMQIVGAERLADVISFVD